MMILVTYDVKTGSPEGKKRLNKVAKVCCDYGQRVQNSVFECYLDPAQLVSFRKRILGEIDETEDSLRIYHLGDNYRNKIEKFGLKENYDPEGVLLF